MATLAIDYMSTAEIGQSLTTAKLEQAYERALRQTERIYEEEKSRVLRVQLLLLEDDNDALQEELVENEARLDQLEDSNEHLRDDLAQTEANLQRVQQDLGSRLRDIEHYRAELNNFSSMSSDSTKLLTEKLALARELANLKPELEHLRSQNVSQQNLLSEKLALQRELSTLQVELETERRTVQRTSAKDKKATEVDSRISLQLEELKKEVAKEKREAQKHARDLTKQASEWEGQKTILESKLEAFRNRLRTTKEQLKEAQTELERAQVAKATGQAESTEVIRAAANPRKRPIARFDPDATIGTPGVGGNAAKRARTSVAVGEKSTFSMTPFLNRTMSLAPDSPATAAAEKEKQVDAEINKQIDEILAEDETSSPARPTKTNKVANTKSRGSQPLKDTTAPKANGGMPKPRNTTSKIALAKVTEEGGDENDEAQENPAPLPAKPLVKKKQKLLGQRKSLFDDDDDDDARPTRPGALLGVSKGLGLRGGAGMGMINLAGKGKTLAEFSPLKKDRKGAAAGVVRTS